MSALDPPVFRFVPCTVKGNPGYEVHHGEVHLGWTGIVQKDEDEPHAIVGWWRLWPRWANEPTFTAELVSVTRRLAAERLLEHHGPYLARKTVSI